MKLENTLDARTLELLGITAKEYSVYVALLKLGTAPLRRIAEVTALNRGTTYDALKRLISVGLVSYVDAKTHRYFTSEDPHKLRSLATKREVALREASLNVDEAIPLLEELQGQSEHRPSVRYFDGEAGVRDILEDVLRTTERADANPSTGSGHKSYRVYSSAGIRDLIAAAWPSFTRERIKRGVRVKAIATGGGGSTAGLDERKWLSKEAAAPTYTFIYAGKTAYVSVDEHQALFGVIIEDPAIAKTQTLIFDGLWKTLS